MGRILFPLINSEEEDPVLRSAALTVLAFLNPSASVETLVRPFENPYVRRATIEILDKPVPVTDPQEPLLIAELSALRGTLTQKNATHRSNEPLFVLSVPICLNAILNTHQCITAAQFTRKTHLTPRSVKE